MKFLSQISVNTRYTLPIVDGTNGQVLSTDGSGTAYWRTIVAGSFSLDGLSDVSIVSQSSDQMLRYGLRQGDTVPVWHNFTPSFLTPSSSINALNDVTITTAATGQLLRYNGSAWVNWTPDFLTSLPAHTHNDIYYTEEEIDAFFGGDTAIAGYNSTNWDVAYGDKINSASFSTTTGILTLTQQDTGTVTVDLDGRFYLDTNPSGYISGISFANVSAKPTTISGYGITDAITTANIGSQSVSYADSSGNSNLLKSLGAYVWSSSTNGRNFQEGLQVSFVRNNEGYQSYGSVVRVHTYPNDGASAELYFPYSEQYGGKSMQYRLGLYNNAGWSSWKTVVDSENIGEYALTSLPAHTHTIANVTGLQTALDGKQASLGFTPYNATNPSGYITSYVNTVTSVGVIDDLSTGDIVLKGAGATTISKSGGTITITSTDTDTNTTYSAGTGLTLTGTAFSVTSDTYAASTHTHTIANVTGLQTELDLKSPIASPTFTGVPSAPTAVTSTNTTQIATTAFVKAQGYITSSSDSQELTWDAGAFELSISNGNSVTISGLASEDFVTSQGYITGYTETDTLASVTNRGNSTTGRINVRGIGNQSGGNIMMGNTGEGVAKWSYLTGTHYNASSQPQGFSLIGGLSTSTYNAVIIGGSIYEANPATEIQFWTHSATTHNLGGTQSGVINSTGWGIGTTSPGAKLDVAGGGVQTTPLIGARGTANAFEWGHGNSAGYGNTIGYYASAGNPYIAFSGEAGTNVNTFKTRGIKSSIILSDLAGGMQFGNVATAATTDNQSFAPLVTILNSGNVGVGTTSPVVKLQVDGTITSTGVLTAYTSVPSINIGHNGNSAFIAATSGSGANSPISFSVGNNNEKMRIDSSGNVGIGTTSPGYKLDIQGIVSVGTTAVGGTLRLEGKGGFSYPAQISTATVSGIKFSDDSGGMNVVFLSTGNVGIGTTNPATYLEVTNATLATDTVNTLLTQRWSRKQTGAVKWGNSIDLLLGSYESGTINSRTRVDFMLANGATDVPDTTVLTLQGNGNVGIGTTNPDQYGFAGRLLAVNGGASYTNIIIAGDANSGIAFGTSTARLGQITMDSTNGMTFYSTGSGNGLTMTLNRSGNVGIGTTSPTAKLEISGFSTGAGLKLNYGNSSGTIEAVNFIANGGANGVIGMQMVSAGVGDLWLGGSGGRTLTLYRDGNVGIGTTDPSTKLHVDGVITATGGNSTNWNTAYGWGNHDDYGYSDASNLSSGTVPYARTNKVLPTSGNYVWNASTRAGDYEIGVQTSFVNAALGFPEYGAVLHIGARGGTDAGGDFQIYCGHGSANGGNHLRFRNADNSANPSDSWTAFKIIWDSENLVNNQDNWNTAYNDRISSAAVTGTTTKTLTLTQGDGGTVTASWTDYDTDNDAQQLSYDPGANQLSISNGNSIALTGLATEEFVTSQGYVTGSYLPLSGGNMTGSISMGAGANIAFTGGSHVIAGNSTGYLHFYDYTDVYFNNQLVIRGGIRNDNGNVLIDDDLTVTGIITEQSSIRYKENVKSIPSVSQKVEQLDAVSYNKIGSNQEEIGLIAEDVAELFPEVVKYDNEGRPDGINYSRLSVILLKAVQELTERVNKLENK